MGHAGLSDSDILRARGKKNDVDPARPYAFSLEPERTADGRIEEVATLFLTNRECPFRCLMCDLWRNTTDVAVDAGAIPAQIDLGLKHLPGVRHVKLYNSGNFSDKKAIPPEDHPAIAARLQSMETVIVENHPVLCGPAVLRFNEMLPGRLEVALGLETAHPTVLERLNKRMTLDDFTRAAGFLRDNDIDVRAFILLRPPFMSETKGVDWALRSIRFAFEAGVQCCSVIPTRAGNGIMDRLERDGKFHPPSMASIEHVLAEGLALGRGRVFMDLWDMERFFDCVECGPGRVDRLRTMNLTQTVLPPIGCKCRTRERIER